MKVVKNVLIIIFIFTCLFIALKLNGISFFNKNNDTIDENINFANTKYKDYKKCKDYDLKNIDRYLLYKKKNEKIDYCDVVTYVNIGLDNEYYTNTEKTDMSYDNLILMNKYLYLDKDYIPDDLEEISSKYFIYGNSKVRMMRKEAKEAFEKLSSDSIKNGTPVYGQSGFREYSRQKELYDYAVSTSGVKGADKDTARPGYSEHQTGLVIDVSSTKDGNMLTFDKTKSFKWMNNNAHKYGFILRYPSDKVDITGYTYESWHYRYIGVKTATDMHDNHSDLSYDEYYYRYIKKY